MQGGVRSHLPVNKGICDTGYTAQTGARCLNFPRRRTTHNGFDFSTLARVAGCRGVSNILTDDVKCTLLRLQTADTYVE